MEDAQQEHLNYTSQLMMKAKAEATSSTTIKKLPKLEKPEKNHIDENIRNLDKRSKSVMSGPGKSVSAIVQFATSQSK